MEVWDLYTENRVLTEKKHIRGNELPDNLYHLVVHVWIKNSKGEYLISQRSKHKSLPLKWECVGGSVLEGETSLQGAIREVKEEIGITLSPDNGKIVFSKVRKMVNDKKFNDILDVWLFSYDGDIDLSTSQTDEVCDACWLTYQEILDLYSSGKFVHTLEYFFTENI